MTDDPAAEFQALRQEIVERIKISYSILALGLAAFGTGLSLAGRASYILAALGALSSVLWLYWTDNSLSIHRIAAYVAIRLAPAAGPPALGWEAYFRRLTAGGDVAADVLYDGAPPEGARRVHAARSADWYTTLLFGGATPILVAIYVADNVRHGGSTPAGTWIAASLGAVALWGYAVLKFAAFIGETRAYRDAILHSSGGA